MGRPRVHDEATARALVVAAEGMVAVGGLEAVSVRGVADAAGVSVRAVYSLFGSKQGLLTAVGARAFEILEEGMRALPVTDDAAADLVEAAVVVFRPFVVEHPSLFQVGVQQVDTSPELVAGFSPAAAAALTFLRARITRLIETEARGERPGARPNATAPGAGPDIGPDARPEAAAGAVAGAVVDGARAVAVDMATVQFHALCEGLGAVELRGMLSSGWEERVWRSGITALVTGFRQTGSHLT